MRMEQIAAVIHGCHQPHTSMLKNDRCADRRGTPRFSKTLTIFTLGSDLLRLSCLLASPLLSKQTTFLKLGRRATPPRAKRNMRSSPTSRNTARPQIPTAASGQPRDTLWLSLFSSLCVRR
jgi:hypothetical protein